MKTRLVHVIWLLLLPPSNHVRASTPGTLPFGFLKAPGLFLLAGGLGGSGTIDGTGSTARFNQPRGLTLDPTGTLYVADSTNFTIRKITATGMVTLLAGTATMVGSTDGSGTAARFNYPYGVAVDSAGTMYVADAANQIIRKITAAGVVTTLAGTAGSAGSVDGTGAAARFSSPDGVAVDSSGVVYVADTYNYTIRKITPAGAVTTLAGTAGTVGSADGSGTAATFNLPNGLTVDSSGTIYVADTGNRIIRKITPAGVVTTLAGTAGSSGSTDGTGAAARFNTPNGVAVDSSGTLFVADGNSTIRMVSPAGVVTTVAGTAGSFGTVDGTGAAARFNQPFGIAVDSSGTMFVSESAGNTIRMVTSAGVVTTFAGAPVRSASPDGTGAAARFNQPFDLALDASGTAYVVDTVNYTLRSVTPAGVVTTLAGSAGNTGSADGTGTVARFKSPGGVALDSSGTIYVADSGSHTIRKVTTAGVVTTFAGTAGSAGSVDGTGTAAKFNQPYGLAIDSAGTVFVAERGNHVIRKITSAGAVTTFAGTAGSAGAVDATGSAARFNIPNGVAVDASGTLYVAERGSHTIRKITSAGVVTTLAGTAGSSGYVDATGATARFNLPSGVVVDTAGNLYIADRANNAIRKISPAGVVTTVVGSSGVGVRLGPLKASLNQIYGPALSGSKLYMISENSILFTDKP